MKAISLWQPWATLIASGAKRIETRSWAPYKLRAGQLVAIHAAKRWTADERDICEDEPFKRCLTLAAERGLWSFEKPPLGCVVAIARFQCAVPTLRAQDGGFDYDQMSDEEYEFGNFGPDRYGWLFSEVRPLEPISTPGQRGLFDWQPPATLPYVSAINAARQLPLLPVTR